MVAQTLKQPSDIMLLHVICLLPHAGTLDLRSRVSAVEWAIIAVGFMNVPQPHGFGPDHSHFLQAKQYTPCHGPSSPTMGGVNICKHSESGAYSAVVPFPCILVCQLGMLALRPCTDLAPAAMARVLQYQLLNLISKTVLLQPPHSLGSAPTR